MLLKELHRSKIRRKVPGQYKGYLRQMAQHLLRTKRSLELIRRQLALLTLTLWDKFSRRRSKFSQLCKRNSQLRHQPILANPPVVPHKHHLCSILIDWGPSERGESVSSAMGFKVLLCQVPSKLRGKWTSRLSFRIKAGFKFLTRRDNNKSK
jgi:hypothetical protein